MRDIQRLTLEEKVGQLFIVGFQGYEPDYETREIIDEIRPAGFILSQRNIATFDQIYGLAANLREMSILPPFLATDHEGGSVDRLKQLFAPIPRMPELASAGITQLRLAAKCIAGELESMGLNLNLAPVLDLGLPGSIIAGRSFSSDAAQVVRLASPFVEELSIRHILTCAKHFPGLGGAAVDPHFRLPRIERTKKQLQQEDAMPFVRLFDAVNMVMVANAHYPGLGDEKPLPASLSTRVVRGFLRKKLKYEGVVITDDLTMGAVTSVGLTPDLFLAALNAGNDLLLFSQTTPLLQEAYQSILRAARHTAAVRRRIDESVVRILRLKGRIQFVPLRYRGQLRNRITRQIDRLRRTLEATGVRAVTI